MSRVIKIIDIAELNRETFKKDEFPDIIKYLDTGSLTKNKIEGFQYLNSNKDKIPSRAQRKIKTNTILYSTVRPNQEHYGIFEKEINDLVVSTGFTTIDIVDENINSKYLFYLLTQRNITEYLHTIGMNAVSSYPSISPNDIGNLKFRVPNLNTQKSIAKVLSDLDAKIELNNKINQELEAMAKTLYDYWFVQFDFPANLQDSTLSGAEGYKSSGGKMVYNEELKREIPEAWEVNSINKFVKVGSGFSFKSDSFYKKGDYRIITIKNVQDGYMDLSKTDYINHLPVGLPEHCLLNPGDILMSLTGNVGRMCLVFNNNCLLNQRVGKLIGENEDINFIYFLLNRPEERVTLENIATGSSQKNLSPVDAVKRKFTTPNKETLINFNGAINPIIERIVQGQIENQKLTELKDWLLPMLMNGQVTVGEAEEKLSMAAEPQAEYKKG